MVRRGPEPFPRGGRAAGVCSRLARQGQDHLRILGFYYPGTALGVLAEGGTARPRLAQLGPLPTRLSDPATLALSRTPAETVHAE